MGFSPHCPVAIPALGLVHELPTFSLTTKFLFRSPTPQTHPSTHSTRFRAGEGGKTRWKVTLSVHFHSPQKMVTALGTHWHPEHFCCVICGEPFGDEGELD